MCHQPFETWIYDHKNLTVEQRRELDLHLKECKKCREAFNTFFAAENAVKRQPMAAPKAGFAARWQVQAEERKFRQTMQLRRFFLFVGLANIAAFTAFLIIGILSGSTINWLVDSFINLGRIVVWWDGLKGFAFSMFQAYPLYVPISIWIVISSAFLTLSLIWLASVWRISTQGVKVK